MLTIAIHGAAGRMGQRLVALASEDAELELVAALDNPAHPRQGDDAGALAGVGPIGVALGGQLENRPGVVIDFSVPDACAAITARCVELGAPLVVATTGLSAAQERSVREAAQTIPVVWAPSMSLTVNLAMKLSEIAAGALANHPSGVDVEILERHHRFKEDAPSGTALGFGKIIAESMGQTRHTHGREGRPGARPRDEIGYHAIRTGDNPGEHTIVFGLLGETLEIRVAASNRDAYAHGALVAAKWIAQQPVGLYGMHDVLGL
jgi:4-hydroxy-tetrahydrodipicolinate reductase